MNENVSCVVDQITTIQNGDRKARGVAPIQIMIRLVTDLEHALHPAGTPATEIWRKTRPCIAEEENAMGMHPAPSIELKIGIWEFFRLAHVRMTSKVPRTLLTRSDVKGASDNSGLAISEFASLNRSCSVVMVLRSIFSLGID